MRCLLIDTTSSYVTVSIVEDNNILYNYHEEIKSDMSSRILPIIDEGFKNINFSLRDIDKIFVANGPGSFTGIRIGVTIAKTIAWTLNIKIVPISSLELMATTKTNKKYIIPMMDARRNNVFAGIYDSDLNLVKDEKLISLNEILKYSNDSYEYVSYDNMSINNVKPQIDILKIISKHINSAGVNPHNLNPRYLKLTEAEENRLKND